MTQIEINQERVVDIFLELARQNTPSKSEKAASELAKLRLESLGFECRWDDAGDAVEGNVGNLIAFKKGTVSDAPPIFFSAHFDTVEATPGLEPIIDGDIIKSGGDTILGADDKCGLAAILEAMHQLHEKNIPHGDIQLLLTICEEIGLLGATHMKPADIVAKYGFVLDSGPPIGAFVYSAPTQNTFEVFIHGKASHAGAAPEDGISAIRIAALAISRMKLGRIDPDTTANVGVIRGGNATNIITPEVYLKCEARSRKPERLEKQMAHMQETFQTAAAELGGTCEMRVQRSYDGYELKMDNPVLKISERATQAIGLDFVLRVSGGGADANVFNKNGIPTTVIGCGMQNIHRHDEFVRISDMVKSAELVVSITQIAADWRE
jgi:tripeptide aminopeptidase